MLSESGRVAIWNEFGVITVWRSFGTRSAGVAVGADDDLLRRHRRPALRRDREAPAVAGERRDAALAVDRGAGLERRPGEAARIGERLDRAAAAVEPAGVVLGRAEMALGRRLVEELGRRAALRPLLGAAAYGLDRVGRMRALDPARPHMRHVHLVPGDKVEHRVRGAAREGDELLAALGKLLHELVRIVFQPGNDLAAVAAGAAPARLI